MSATRRGANSKTTAYLRRREDAARGQAEEIAEEAKAANTQAPPKAAVEVSDAEKAALSKFTVAQLKERLEALGADTKGKKAELITRLLEVGYAG